MLFRSDEAPEPISLRPDVLPPPRPQPDTRPTLTLVMTALVFLLAGLLIATLVYGSEGGVDESELNAAVERAVGTQFALLPPAASGGGEPANIQQMIDQAVGTQVALLQPTNTPIPPTPTVMPPEVYQDDDAFLGPADAPVTIVEFSDFQCGYCGRWYNDTLPQILEKYPDEVKFIYRDFPIFGEDSIRAAMAAECAEEQEAFWDMHNIIFDTVTGGTQVTLSQDTLVSMAGDLDLDTDAFVSCLESERYMSEIQADYQDAVAWGFRGTPGFVVNGVVYPIGAQPFEVFDQIIQEHLAS